MFYFELYVLAVLSEILYAISLTYYEKVENSYKEDLQIIVSLSPFLFVIPVVVALHYWDCNYFTKQRRFWWKK